MNRHGIYNKSNSIALYFIDIKSKSTLQMYYTQKMQNIINQVEPPPPKIYIWSIEAEILAMHTYDIGGVMASVLASSVVDRWLELQSGQTKDYKIGICWFSAKHVALTCSRHDMAEKFLS